MDNTYLTKEKVMDTLSVIIDPELGVSIVDLGLIYGIEIKPDSLSIDVTLTTPACPLTSYIEDQIKEALEAIADGVEINWVWEPAWSISKITESGKEQLEALGYNFG